MNSKSPENWYQAPNWKDGAKAPIYNTDRFQPLGGMGQWQSCSSIYCAWVTPNRWRKTNDVWIIMILCNSTERCKKRTHGYILWPKISYNNVVQLHTALKSYHNGNFFINTTRPDVSWTWTAPLSCLPILMTPPIIKTIPQNWWQYT